MKLELVLIDDVGFGHGDADLSDKVTHSGLIRLPL